MRAPWGLWSCLAWTALSTVVAAIVSAALVSGQAATSGPKTEVAGLLPIGVDPVSLISYWPGWTISKIETQKGEREKKKSCKKKKKKKKKKRMIAIAFSSKIPRRKMLKRTVFL